MRPRFLLHLTVIAASIVGETACAETLVADNAANCERIVALLEGVAQEAAATTATIARYSMRMEGRFIPENNTFVLVMGNDRGERRLVLRGMKSAIERRFFNSTFEAFLQRLGLRNDDVLVLGVARQYHMIRDKVLPILSVQLGVNHIRAQNDAWRRSGRAGRRVGQ